MQVGDKVWYRNPWNGEKTKGFYCGAVNAYKSPYVLSKDTFDGMNRFYTYPAEIEPRMSLWERFVSYVDGLRYKGGVDF